MNTPLRPPAGDDHTTWAFAPASVSNVACGFDVVGFALAAITEVGGEAAPLGDWVGARPHSGQGIRVAEIHGDQGILPRAAERNTAAVAADAVCQALGAKGCLTPGEGVELLVHKRMPISSGIGSSAASAAAAAAAVDAMFGRRLDQEELLECALAGEFVASRSRHADNVAPALVGGLLAIRSLDPVPDFFALPIPSRLTCALVLPEISVSTSAARTALGKQVRLTDAVQQSANLAALVHALHREDFALLSRALVDLIAEPVRKSAVPGFDQAMAAARQAGALGGSLSGSGPALFALCQEGQEGDLSRAASVADAMRNALLDAGVTSGALAARITTRGAVHNVCNVQAGTAGSATGPSLAGSSRT